MLDKVFSHVTADLDKHNNIGIMVSGGLDSALLLYMINRWKTTNKITVYTVPKYDGSADHSPDVVQWVNSELPIKIVGNRDVAHNKQVASGLREIDNTGEVDRIYIAHTVVPEHLDFPGGLKVVRQPNKRPEWIFLPFMDLNIDKRGIISMANKLLTQDNFETWCKITHSCTETTGTRCGICWHCQERAWAFREAGLIDVGTM